MNPKLSICMPVYNQERFLREAIESVLSQDFRDFELIIADDHSSDTTLQIVRACAEADRRIRLLENEKTSAW